MPSCGRILRHQLGLSCKYYVILVVVFLDISLVLNVSSQEDIYHAILWSYSYTTAC